MKKIEYVTALRELADFVESKDFPEKWASYFGTETAFDKPTLNFSVQNKNDFGKIAAAMGSFEKLRDSYSTGALKKMPSGAIIHLTASREVVCKKIVVGTRTVPAKPERILEAEPEREEEIVEWECPESFVALKEEETAHAE